MLNVAELSALMSAQLKKGVFTNSSMTAYGYLEDDPLTEAVSSGGSLLIFRHRPGFSLMNYYVQQDCKSIEIPDFCQCPIVCETAFRPKDEAAADRVMALLAGAGFEPALDRIRLSRSGCGGPPGGNVRIISPGPDQTQILRTFLLANFNPLTGCIPPAGVLAKDLFAVAETDGEITGMLHFSVERSFWEIRHLAVAPELRGKGLAARLLDAAQAEAGRISGSKAEEGLRCRVWTGADNAPAIKFYEKHGFTADAYKSKVLIRNIR